MSGQLSFDVVVIGGGHAGVEAALHVHEGQAHGGWYRDYTAPEAKETFEEIARFFDKHLGR